MDYEHSSGVENKIFDVIVLGAGISGLVSASILNKKGYNKILVIDSYPTAGGNHASFTIGDYTYDIGSFIFQDDSPLLEHFPELMPNYIPIDPSWSRINAQGKITQYPISFKDDVFLAGPIEWIRILASLIFARISCRRINNAWDFARYWIGARLLERTGLEKYMERFYGRPATSIEVEFAQQRMGWLKEYASFNNPMLKRMWTRKSYPKNVQLVRPKEGFEFLYRTAVSRLENEGVVFALNTSISEISKHGSKIQVTLPNCVVESKQLISTMPLNKTLKLCGMPEKPELENQTLLSLFYSFQGRRGFTSSIVYNFSLTGQWKRLTMHSDFYGTASGREFFNVEANICEVKSSVSEIELDFRSHSKKHGMFMGDLRLEGSAITTNAYPIYLSGSSAAAQAARLELTNFGITPLGRQGKHDYQPTARESTVKAEEELKRW